MLIRRFKSISLLFSSLLLISACGSQRPSLSQLAVDSASTVALNAVSTAGQVLLPPGDNASYLAGIKKQMNYTTGHLGHVVDSMPELERTLQIEILAAEPEPTENSESTETLVRVRYKVQFVMHWQRGANAAVTQDLRDVPTSYTLLMPLRADNIGLQDFANRYGTNCGGSTDINALWYYFDPGLANCELKQEGELPNLLRMPITMSMSDLNTEGHSPEYTKVWEDGRLDVMFYAGNILHESAAHAGEWLLASMARTYGEPVSLNIDARGTYNWIDAEYRSADGRIIALHIADMLTIDINSVDVELAARIGEASARSDLVAYNGHAGLGVNVRKFTTMTQFTTGRYYLYWINACRPLAYIDHTLDYAAQQANPGEPASRYLDIMTVGGIGGFYHGADVQGLIGVLLERRQTYREITAEASRGSPVVIGEEDNP